MPNKTGNSKYRNVAPLKPQNRLYFACVLIVLGVLSRTVFHIGDNIELVTVAALLSGSYLGFFWAAFVPLTIMVLSDLIIGNTLIFLFTWSAYLLIGIAGYAYFRKAGSAGNLLKPVSAGIISSLFFYLWTNFGVWALDSFGMYREGIEGLVDSYVMGLPFLKANLISNLIIVPVFFRLFQIMFLGKKVSVFGKNLSISK